MMRGLVLAVLMISAATAAVASPAAVKVQLPCESRDQMPLAYRRASGRAMQREEHPPGESSGWKRPAAVPGRSPR